jgi:hypothetical protein
MAHTLCLDLVSRARAVLGSSRIFDLRSLDVEQDGACVVLRGSVGSFYHKQLAQELLKTRIEGVEVVNEIDVEYRLDRAGDEEAWWYS